MNYNTVYVGMDVHKESFSLCAYTIEAEKASHYQRTEADYKKVLNYLEFLRTIYGDNANFICGYEAGCFGYTLYHQLTANNVKCIILAPTTMLEQRSKKRIKTDRRDAEIIAKCLAQHNYSPVHIPTAKDEETKEFLRMRDDHVAQMLCNHTSIYIKKLRNCFLRKPYIAILNPDFYSVFSCISCENQEINSAISYL